MSAKRAPVEPSPAEVTAAYGPFDGKPRIAGVTFDGEKVWFASGQSLHSVNPDSGAEGASLPVPGNAGTAFDGRHFFQVDGNRIHKIDAKSGAILKTIQVPVPGHCAGLAWAEGTLWLGMHHERKIHQLDPETGRVLRTLESSRCVTGITWVDGELWHGTLEDGQSEIRNVDPESGEVLERLAMPSGQIVSGLESDGRDRFFCGSGDDGVLRVVRRPRRKQAGRAGK